MEHPAEKVAERLFTEWCGCTAEQILPLPPSGSNRQYYRVRSGKYTAIAACNPDKRENHAFLSLSRIFLDAGLPVPAIFAKNLEAGVYLLEDLGDTTLFSLLPGSGDINDFDGHLINLYKKTIRLLPVFQIDAAREIDFSICYPRHSFDRQSMQWDLNYFKYYFLKTSGIPFDEQLLEDDFNALMNRLLQEQGEMFMYRDMQSRNVMIVDNEPCFIDYQGGRKGPPAYDIASLLFDAKANLPHPLRADLLSFYMDCLEEKKSIDRQAFRLSFYDFVLMRILQSLGTYGFRGGIEKKGFFSRSLPYALKNLTWLSDQGLLPETTPYLNKLIRQLASKKPAELIPPPARGLTVTVSSFSYKKGIPPDHSGHGGGFVFDCRALPNPGREEQYKALTGLDEEVTRFLSPKKQVGQFISHAIGMVTPAVETYTERGFTNLTVCFGCTGGRHRSVYCAELMAKHLRENYNITVYLTHTEAGNWKG
ncbi:MAG: phosphotransferase [Bacteroidales bacterium]